MGEPSAPEPALRLLAAFSRHEAALSFARAKAEEAWGEIAIASPIFSFRETEYYERTMGSDLAKVFFVFAEPFDPGELACMKLQTGEWERECAAHSARRRAPIESRSRLLDRCEAGPGFDQGPCPSHLSRAAGFTPK